ncbi:MAG: DUF192 domain-containing protein, partial [Candidatus Taylorbacteria bacterium]|nr:DUF192 domain-containing protein [Candidatus Taylorbacteria bacterium]
MSKELAKKLLLFLLGVLVLSFIIWSGFYQKDITFPKGQAEKVISLSIGHKPIKAYVADTPLSQERGLSGRQSIGSDQAMLFAFAAPARYGIWMK